MASPAEVRHELANTLIECDGTADETVAKLVAELLEQENSWRADLRNLRDDRSFLEWLATDG